MDKLKLLTRGLNSVTVVGILGLGSVTFMGLSSPYQISPDEFRTQQEAAVVRKYEGSDSLYQILANHGFQMRYSGMFDSRGYTETRKPVAIVNASDALADACSTDRFASTEVCKEYGKIPEATAEYSSTYSPPDRQEKPAAIGFGSAAILGLLGILVKGHARKPE